MAFRLTALLVACALVFVGLGDVLALARVIEEQTKVSVRVATAQGKAVEREIVVTVFYDDAAPRPYPVLVLNHGRSSKSAERAAVRSVQFSAASRWLTGLGFLVAVPIRVGYGATGGEDVEDSGACARKNYPPVYLAATAQTLAVLGALRKRADVAKDRAVVMGQSFGGTTAITVASLNPVGVQAAINFAGGGGGNPKTRPHNPCSQAALLRLFADYGKTARIPTLWVYSENDLYFGPKLPKIWFEAFKASGGVGEYTLFPAYSDNGHLFFSRAPQLWQPRVLRFVESLGYQPPQRRQGGL
jgi:dienelactone hydrolase